MSINDKINFKAIRLPILKAAFEKHNIKNPSRVLKIALFGCNWDEWRFGIKFINPIIGRGIKSFRRIKTDNDYERYGNIRIHLLSTGFCGD